MFPRDEEIAQIVEDFRLREMEIDFFDDDDIDPMDAYKEQIELELVHKKIGRGIKRGENNED